MSVTVELSELDAVLWDAFKRGGEWVNASEYRKLKAENAKLRELVDYMTPIALYGASEQERDRMRELGVVE